MIAYITQICGIREHAAGNFGFQPAERDYNQPALPASKTLATLPGESLRRFRQSILHDHTVTKWNHPDL
jgi:hypothetical protein